jgi:hypothetical protein
MTREERMKGSNTKVRWKEEEHRLLATRHDEDDVEQIRPLYGSAT